MDSSVIAFPGRSVGIVSISIDVDLASPADYDQTQSVSVELQDRFNKRGVAASWALANPIHGALSRQINLGRPDHEVALLAAEQPHSPESRAQIVERVVRPLKQAAAAGIFISSLAVVGRWRPQHVDLLAKHGITVIRGSSRHGSAGRIEPVCYAMWHVPVAVDMRGGGWMANHAQLRLSRRAVGLAMRDGSFCHLRIDAAALAKGDVACSLRTVDRLLRDLVQIRDAGQIAIETLRDTAARLAPKRVLPAARSILRAA
jgi:nitrous oxide reductase accessory protein NosL